jgi:hypothetical protein
MKKLTEEHRRKLSEAHKGQKAWNKGLKGVMPRPWNKGKAWDEDIKLKISKALQGHIPWNKGKQLSPEHIEHLRTSHLGKKWSIKQKEGCRPLKGKKHWNWAGERVGNNALHTWLRREYGKPYKCENPECKYPKKDYYGKIMLAPTRYEWSNKKGNYSRDRNEWWMLCPSCHRKYDYKFKIKRK